MRGRLRKVSKALSRMLRHDPERFGVELDDAGWTPVAAAWEALRRAGHLLDPPSLDEVLQGCDKRRFELNPDGTHIRAVHGHSVAVDLRLEPARPHTRLYHGTVERFLDAILREGLRPMGRRHVHLSESEEDARRVGSRRGSPILLTVDSDGLHADGATFYRSESGVWLTPHVPPERLGLPSDPT